MTKRHYIGGVVLACATIIGAAAQNAQEPGKQPQQPQMTPEQAAEMQKWMEYSTPGEAHSKLSQKAGNWNLEVSQWQAPGTEPMVTPATASFEMILGGRYLAEHVNGDFMGMPFEGMGVTGYDNALKKNVSAWIDNMGTGIMVGEGHTKGKKTEGFSTGTDPMTGKAMKMRFVETETSKDEFKVEMYGPGPDGKEFKMMEIVYKRSAA